VSCATCAKTAKPIEMPFGLWAPMYSRNYVFDGVQIPHGKGQFLEERTCSGMPDDTFPYFVNSWRGIFIGQARYDVQSAVSTHKHNISLKSAQYLRRRRRRRRKRRRRRSKPNSDDQARKTVALSCSLINEHEHDLRKLTSLVVNCGFFGF